MPIKVDELVGNLLLFQNLDRIPGYKANVYYGNTPLWFLPYLFYAYNVGFLVLRYIREKHQTFIVLSLSILGISTYILFPNTISHYLSYLFIWWSGYNILRKGTKNSFYKIVLGHLLLIGILVFFIENITRQTISHHPIIEIRHYAASIVFTIIIFFWKDAGYPIFIKLNVFRLCGKYAMPIYFYHFPVLTLLTIYIHPIILLGIILLTLLTINQLKNFYK